MLQWEPKRESKIGRGGVRNDTTRGCVSCVLGLGRGQKCNSVYMCQFQSVKILCVSWMTVWNSTFFSFDGFTDLIRGSFQTKTSCSVMLALSKLNTKIVARGAPTVFDFVLAPFVFECRYWWYVISCWTHTRHRCYQSYSFCTENRPCLVFLPFCAITFLALFCTAETPF
jgi:hypothetical protein